ncbi:MAG: hypothetical protein LBL75_01990 [Rickettsiales bacterium]|jgi:hypothetical protein|nr:hypothetical protein [Rickettsiales bacterium]
MNKKIMKIITFAGLAIVMAGAAHAAAPENAGLCELITKLQGVFGILRTLAFVGAAFVIASIGWDAITKKEYKWDTDGKKHLIGLITGFVLLFSVGVLLQFLMNDQVVSCPNVTTGW